MWQELLIALAMVMVIEGILPFISPGAMRKMMEAAGNMNDQALRISGLVSMILGVAMLYLVN